MITKLKKDKMMARKNGEKLKISSLDSVLVECDKARIQNKKDLTDDNVLSVIKKVVTEFKETAEMYNGYGKTQERDEHIQKAEILESYLPTQLTKEQIESEVTSIISQTNASSMKDMGKVMSALKSKFGAALDMGIASKLVKENLT